MAVDSLVSVVDRVEILTVIDNVFDLLLRSTDVARRIGLGGPQGRKTPVVEAPLLESGHAAEVPIAEHGLSFLVSVTLRNRRRTILFDAGSTVDGLVHNLRVLGVERVERRYDGENCLCCGLTAAMFTPHQAPAIRQRNLDDAQAAGAQAMCYLCPMCSRGLGDDARARGLAGYHIIELTRMALGELPLPV